MISDTFETLRPKMKRFTSFEEAHSAIVRLEQSGMASSPTMFRPDMVDQSPKTSNDDFSQKPASPLEDSLAPVERDKTSDEEDDEEGEEEAESTLSESTPSCSRFIY